MNRELKYNATDKLSDLICENYLLLQVTSRFGLPLGFGEKSVGEVCTLHHVDTATFLAVVNFINENYSRVQDAGEELSVAALIDYLKQSHSYFLDFCLPAIRERLVRAIDGDEKEWSALLLRFFDDYVNEVRKHMNYEDKTVFTFAAALQNGKRVENYNIITFSKQHKSIEGKLSELKNIIIKYYPSHQNNHLLNGALADIFACEEELNSHCKVEDYIFVPTVLKLERRLANANK
ncbi:MAG: hemerythrin domain-containing protein [Prevotellaceae bacterium]|jgi:regulator of cell morphogenesis and NO signaling|nr:hemerythrin domain-containing protein [Prevotellaceae bacterium]